jgi:uncharacterized SAM-binding protein YcdF (DUF218 family)
MKLSTSSIRNAIEKVKSTFRFFIMLLGWCTLFAIVLSFTDLPFKMYYWLATKGADLKKRPDYIVMLGGVGMPSPEDLIRIYTTAGAWHEVPDSKVIVAFPPDTLLKRDSPELLMARDLILRGVDSSRILFEREGISTRTQSQKIATIVGPENLDSVGIRIVTSPEHMFRAVRAFRKIGFRYVGGSPAFERAIDENRLIQGKKKKSEKRFLNIRYNMWSYLKYEITILREFCAIGYYKIRGWI